MSNISTSAKRPKGSPPLPCSEMWLFPSIAAEKREERSAAAREAVQVVREEKRKAVAWLRKRNLTWLIDKLVDGGPATEISLMFAAANEMSSMEEGAPVLMDVWALWRIGKLWRKSKGRHFGSGEETFLYGLRKVHSQNVSDQTPRTQDVANTTDSLERLSASVLFGLLLLVGFISGPSSVGAQETPIDHPRPAESHRTTDKMDNTGNPIILGNEAEPRLEALSADTYGKSAFGSFGEPSPQTSGTAHSALESSLTDQVGSLSGGERASESTMQARRLSPTGFVLLGVIVQLLLMAATWSNVVPVEHPKWLSLNIRYTAVAVLITMLLQPYVLSLVSSLESSGALIHCPNVQAQIPRTQDVANTTDSPERLSAAPCSSLVRDSE